MPVHRAAHKYHPCGYSPRPTPSLAAMYRYHCQPVCHLRPQGTPPAPLLSRRSSQLAGCPSLRSSSDRNPLTPERLIVPPGKQSMVMYASPLYRMALAAILDLRYTPEPPREGQAQYELSREVWVRSIPAGHRGGAGDDALFRRRAGGETPHQTTSQPPGTP